MSDASVAMVCMGFIGVFGSIAASTLGNAEVAGVIACISIFLIFMLGVD